MVEKTWLVLPSTSGECWFNEDFDVSYNWDRGADIRRVYLDVRREWAFIKITTPSSQQCQDELDGQLSDGIFENINYSVVIEC